VEIAARRKKLTIFFSDITNFTETSDNMESEELTNIVNQYFDGMSKIALESTHATSEGGVPHYVASLGRALAKRHEVTVYSSRFESFGGTGVRHRKIRAIGSRGNIFDLSFLIVSTLVIWGHRLKRRDEFDIIHSHVGSPFFSDVFTSHFYEHDGIAQMKTAAKDMPRDSLARRLRSRLMARLESALLTQRNSRTWIVLSSAMKSGFIRNHAVPPDRIFVIPNGVDSSRYNPDNIARFREEVRGRLSLTPGDQMVLATYAIGYNVLLGYTGLLSLGHAMFFAAGLYGDLGDVTALADPSVVEEIVSGHRQGEERARVV